MAKEKHRKEDKMSFVKKLDHHQLLELLSQGFCQHCQAHLETRARSFFTQTEKVENGKAKACADGSWSSRGSNKTDPKRRSSRGSPQTPQLVEEKDCPVDSSFHVSSNNNTEHHLSHQLGSRQLTDECDAAKGEYSSVLDDLSEEQENIQVSQLGRKDDFCCLEKIDGRVTNVLQGLQLYTRVFSLEEQRKVVKYVDCLQRKGRAGHLIGRTYAEPRKWMRGKGRVTMQFGCCYNYAPDKHGNPPGIVRDAEVEPLPNLFKQMIKRLVRWHIMPATCVPDSCIVNIYEEGDCIPPHIDHHDFVRPFCTVSLLSGCDILFGSNLQIVGAGEFDGDTPIHLPVGSVLILNGNAANIAEHCISAVSKRRISITFRKMDSRKVPYNFRHDPEMQRIERLASPPVIKSHTSHNSQKRKHQSNMPTINKYSKTIRKKSVMSNEYYMAEEDDYRPVRRVRQRK